MAGAGSRESGLHSRDQSSRLRWVQGSGFSVQLFVGAFAWIWLMVWQAAGAAEPTYYDDLASLAKTCDEFGLKSQAELTRKWIVLPRPGRSYLYLAPSNDPGKLQAGASDLERKWHKRFLELRGVYAEHLYRAARQASDDHQPARAYQLLHEVLRESPEHTAARSILGEPISELDRLKVERPKTAHPKLRWPAGSYWRLETPHFTIVTNHSPRAAQDLARELEDLHVLWRQIFFRYWSSGEALKARFAGRDEPLARPRPRMNVVLVKDREEYVRHLRGSVPQIEQTVGIYLNHQRTSFFYAGDASVVPVWYHEAAHQLFQEAIPDAVAQPGERQNFWAVEGAAIYLESLTRHDGWWTAGGCEADRLQFARYRTLAGDSQPIERLAALGREQVQTSPEISRLYSSAAGLAHFLIDGQDGKHREAFVDLMKAIYRGEDDANTLAHTTGQTLEELDNQYREFLNVTDEDLAGIPRPERLKNVSLGRTSVTDKGLANLTACRELRWLDLSHLPVTDEGFRAFAPQPMLTQLFLEGTKITDEALPQIARCQELEELDLSNLAISDEGLAAISNLKKLRVLYLTGSPVTDAGLDHLKSLKQLHSLETTGTKATSEGRTKLEAAIPKLKLAD
jgi:hypothetical protein